MPNNRFTPWRRAERPEEAEEIRHLITEAGLNYSDIAGMLKISPTTLSHQLSGYRNMDPDLLSRVGGRERQPDVGTSVRVLHHLQGRGIGGQARGNRVYDPEPEGVWLVIGQPGFRVGSGRRTAAGDRSPGFNLVHVGRAGVAARGIV